MAASLTVGELAALLKNRRDKTAAAASTATARVLSDVFAVAERDDFEVRFRCGHQDSLGRLRRGRARRPHQFVICRMSDVGLSDVGLSDTFGNGSPQRLGEILDQAGHNSPTKVPQPPHPRQRKHIRAS